MKSFKEFAENFGHYPAQVDPKKDKTKGDWVTGDPDKPIMINPNDVAGSIKKANQAVNRERGTDNPYFEMGESYDPSIYMVEKLSVSDGQQAWIDDFLKSDAPQFKGKSKEEIVKMAVAAFNAAKQDENYVSHAQRKAVWANRADGGKGHPDKKKKNEEVAVNSTGPAVDMNPTGKPKKFNDGRSKYDINKMFRRNGG